MKLAASASVVASLSLGIVAVGCAFGGDKEASLSRAEYVKQADAVCSRSFDRLARGERRGSSSVAGIDRELRKALVDLRRLHPPTDLEADAYRFQGALERQLDIARDTPTIDEDPSAPADAELDELTDYAVESERAARESDRLARAIGLRVCGRR